MLEQVLTDLKDLKGFQGALISDYSGEPLVNEIQDNNIDFMQVCHKLNTLFHDMHILTTDYALGEVSIMSNANEMLQVYNHLGKLVFQKNLIKGSNKVNLEKLPKGTYLFKTRNRSRKLIYTK